MNVYF